MNAADVVTKLSKAIQAVEAFKDARTLYPKESAAAVEMFVRCYPKREPLIRFIADSEDSRGQA